MSHYPKLEINLSKLSYNAKYYVDLCGKKGIDVTGVVKGFNGLPEAVKAMEEGGFAYLASSRIEQLEDIKEAGVKTPLFMIRIPMISEAERIVETCDMSLQSDISVMRIFNEEAIRQGKVHNVLMMVDIGDLREGFWDRDELCEAAAEVEAMEGLHLMGVGTNIGCYGAVMATADKLSELVDAAEAVEARIGRKLRYISGGATSSLPRVLEGDLPERINMLRIGEAIIVPKAMDYLWGYKDFMGYPDVFVLKAQVLEVKDKPSHPVGQIMFDAFGNTPVYEDRGIRKRALLGVGKADCPFINDLYPRMKGVEVIGASSDHMILDIEEADEIKPGDILEFDMKYSGVLFLTSSRNVNIEYVK